ncbi:hypothetical protein [Arthrobacter polaris]|uniref:hypothetical protein n=1 Tax=Arthrobacter polaris TaxID=2813727 RepID=UPI001F3D0D25|nr:hypothetical protein [Arthrobacter polaris]UIK89823.1 hypothetical protein J0916_05595 [Arthrobacter polaris]
MDFSGPRLAWLSLLANFGTLSLSVASVAAAGNSSVGTGDNQTADNGQNPRA